MVRSTLDLGPERLQVLSREHSPMIDLGMFIVAAGCGCHGLESVEDHVSEDVGGVVQASKPDLMARGIAVDLLQMAKRVGPQSEAAEYENLPGEKNLTLDCGVVDD